MARISEPHAPPFACGLSVNGTANSKRAILSRVPFGRILRLMVAFDEMAARVSPSRNFMKPPSNGAALEASFLALVLGALSARHRTPCTIAPSKAACDYPALNGSYRSLEPRPPHMSGTRANGHVPAQLHQHWTAA